MIETSKINPKILNNPNYNEIEKHIFKYTYDLIDDNYCKEILSVEITDFNEDNIKDLIIKYVNIDNNIVTRTTKLRQSTIIKKIPKGVYERQNIKPFGKASEGNNFPMLERYYNFLENIAENVIEELKYLFSSLSVRYKIF